MRKSHTHDYRPTCKCWRCAKTRRRLVHCRDPRHATPCTGPLCQACRDECDPRHWTTTPIATFAAELDAQPGAAVAPFALVAPPNDAIDASQLRLLELSPDARALRELIRDIRRSKVQS